MGEAAKPRADGVALGLAAGMAFLAGATDVYGLDRLGGEFVSFMSGNTTLLGIAVGQANWARAASFATLIGLFVGGAAAGAAVGVLGGRRHAGIVALAVAATLTMPLLRPGWATPAFVLAMGALNGSMNRAGPVPVGLTYVTGTLVRFGQGLGRTLCGRPDGWGWLWQAPMWLSLLAGAVAAILVRQQLGADALWPLPVLALVLALGALARERR